MIRLIIVFVCIAGNLGFAGSLVDLIKRSVGKTGSYKALLNQIKDRMTAEEICRRGGVIRAAGGQACKDPKLYSLAYHICTKPKEIDDFKVSDCVTKGDRALVDFADQEEQPEVTRKKILFEILNNLDFPASIAVSDLTYDPKNPPLPRTVVIKELKDLIGLSEAESD